MRTGVKPLIAAALFTLLFAGTGSPVKSQTSAKVLTKETTVAATLQEVWDAWTTPKGVTSFLTPHAKVEARVGGPFEVYFNGKAEPGLQGSEGCKFMAIEPMKMLSFSWNAPPDMPDMRKQHTLVVVKFQELAPKSVKVTLSQMGWGDGPEWDKNYAYFNEAWPFVLGALKDRFEKGPVKWPESPLPAPKKHWMYVIKMAKETTLKNPTDDEVKALRGHFAHLQRALATGQLVLAGPCTDFIGPAVVIFEAKDEAAAKDFMNSDPAVKGGVFLATLHPFTMALHRE
jgi:uncharacterized protein YndB with AHSA1/START domain/uncharacterized protein YciI